MTEINFKELFYNELHKDDNDDNIGDTNLNNEKTDKICNISNEIADETYIELECNHGFNYDYIYNEIYKQKYVVNIRETVKLSKFQIKCPYCRHVQDKLLPGNEGYDNLLYVNMPKKHRMKKKNCVYVFKGGKKKGLVCDELCEEQFCDKCTILEKKRLARRCKKQNG